MTFPVFYKEKCKNSCASRHTYYILTQSHVLHDYLCIIGIGIIYAKLGVFSQFLEIGTSDGLGNAYNEKTKQSLQFDKSITHARHRLCIISIFMPRKGVSNNF